jgi:hypothetical protein
MPGRVSVYRGVKKNTSPLTTAQWCHSLCALLLGLFIASPSTAQTIDWRSNMTSLELQWTGSGDLTGTSTGCIRSRRNGSRAVDYGIMGIQSFNGDFLAVRGSDSMVLELDFEGIALTDGGFTGTVFQGSTNCNSVTMDVRISESQLQNLPQGRYTTAGVGTYGRLIICATPAGSTNCDISPREPYEDSDMEIAVTIPAYTRLFNVGDFELPDYDGVAASVEKDMAFCVKSTSSSAGYRLTATSDTHHANSGDFAISKDGVGSSGETIPYTLLFAASPNPAAGNKLVSGATVGPFTGSLQNQCSGAGDNASMRVVVEGGAIQAASPGSYSGVITIKVEPE